jgi:aminoglycoside phosphotransferase (APT) family kinase protein
MGVVDDAVKTRSGEELDPEKVGTFLKDNIPNLNGEVVIRQFPSGFSNLTYLVGVGDTEFVLRRPPFGKKAKTAHDMLREYRILKALKPVFPYCPEAMVYSEDADVMGCPFYVMERIKGVIFRKDIPPELGLDDKKNAKLCERMVEVLCELHALDYKKIGLQDFAKPEGYIRRQVEGWSGRYRDARTEDAPDFESVMEWLDKNQPPDTDKPTIIHNDYKFDNLVLDPANPMRIIGVLDWEMATIGDPLMDLGSSLAYWIDRTDSDQRQMMRLMPTNAEGMMTRSEIVRAYEEKSGRKIESFDFYLCFGLFRLAVIAQQIYYRFFHGQTKDKRFAMLIFAVKILEDAALEIVNK